MAAEQASSPLIVTVYTLSTITAAQSMLKQCYESIYRRHTAYTAVRECWMARAAHRC
jgi:hypothetical protein